MNTFKDLYDFIDFAKGNRKYPENTANGLKSALKIFEKELNVDELNSVDLIEDNIEEIFLSTVTKNKDKNIGSLNTYKARLLKVINDYQKYGKNPSKIQNWTVSLHKATTLKSSHKHLSDKEQDNTQIGLSDTVNTPVNKVELSLRDNIKSMLVLPKDITAKEAQMVKNIIDALTINK